AVILVPVGFTSDHMEIVFDLDVEAVQAAERLGLPLARAGTPGTDPRFVAMITELVRERQDGRPPRALGELGPALGTCGNGCCGAGAGRPASRGSAWGGGPRAARWGRPAGGRGAARGARAGRRG